MCQHADQIVGTSIEPTRPSENTSDVDLKLRAPKILGESSYNSNQQPSETQPVRWYLLPNRSPNRLIYK